ncbi:MAG: dienelactone hydrolase family protein [Acidimicrobiia bacterium]
MSSEAPLLVLHEGWGRSADIDSVVDRFSHRGYTVTAPDLFEGSSPLRAFAPALVQLRTGRGSIFDVARSALDSFGSSRPVAVLGLSLGAAVALRMDIDGPVVAAYGHVPRKVAARGPILGIFGSADFALTRSAALLATHPNADVRTFDGAGHSFLIDPSVGVPWKIPSVGPHPAASQAWEAICEFLDSRRDAATGDFGVSRGQ